MNKSNIHKLQNTKAGQKYNPDLNNLLNISAKFAGMGGNSSSLAPKKLESVPRVPKTGVYTKKNLETTIFKKYYDRGDLPIAVAFIGAQRKITWKLEPEFLDYHLYLPIFFEGLREPEEPYKFLADRGCRELIEKGGNKLLPVLPQLILPIKSSLDFIKNVWVQRILRSCAEC